MTIFTAIQVQPKDVLDHPFILSAGGMLMWFTIRYFGSKKRGEAKGIKDFYKKFIDEILLTAIMSMLVIIFDDEILLLLREYTNMHVPDKVHSALYLLSPILADKVVKMFI